MDKQKQIEEMAKELCPYYDNGNCYYEFTEVCKCRCGCEFCWAVSQVLNAGYRKIPENAVVLTREEYEKLFIDSFGIMTSSIGDLPINPKGMRKAVDEIDRLIAVQGELQVINAKYYNEAKDLRRNMTKLRRETYSKEEVDYKTEHLRKETAEKFAERVKMAFYYEFDELIPSIMADKIDEICKEIMGGKV